MCPQTDLIKQLEGIAAVTALRKTLMAAEVQSGESVPEAARALLPHERQAKMRFSEIFQLMNSGTELIMAELDKTADVVRDVLFDAIDGSEVTAAAIPAMIRLRAKQPQEMIAAELAAAYRIRDILSDVYSGGSQIVMGEATRQGVKLGKRNPLAPAAQEFLPAATALAMVPWTQALAGLQTALLLDQSFLDGEVDELAARKTRKTVKAPTELVDMVDQAATKSAGKARDAAKQETHVAHGKGRTRTAAKLKPSLIWASELLDSATCGPCRKMDGREYKTLAGGRRAYPNGPYKNCLGGNRCRGTLVFIYDEPEENWE